MNSSDSASSSSDDSSGSGSGSSSSASSEDSKSAQEVGKGEETPVEPPPLVFSIQTLKQMFKFAK